MLECHVQSLCSFSNVGAWRRKFNHLQLAQPDFKRPAALVFGFIVFRLHGHFVITWLQSPPSQNVPLFFSGFYLNGAIKFGNAPSL